MNWLLSDRSETLTVKGICEEMKYCSLALHDGVTLTVTCYRVKSFSNIVKSQSGKSAADVSKRPLLSPCMDILKEGKIGCHKLLLFLI